MTIHVHQKSFKYGGRRALKARFWQTNTHLFLGVREGQSVRLALSGDKYQAMGSGWRRIRENDGN